MRSVGCKKLFFEYHQFLLVIAFMSQVIFFKIPSMGDICKFDNNFGLFATHPSSNSNTRFWKRFFLFLVQHSFCSRQKILHREDLDNPHKPKTWQHFHKNFTLEVGFQTFCWYINIIFKLINTLVNLHILFC